MSNFNKRKLRVRSGIKRHNKLLKPRISVFRSNKNIYAQLISAKEGNIICSFSSLLIPESESKDLSGVKIAALVGKRFTEICIRNNIKQVVFDKGAYLYSGRVKALAESCREFGLQF